MWNNDLHFIYPKLPGSKYCNTLGYLPHSSFNVCTQTVLFALPIPPTASTLLITSTSSSLVSSGNASPRFMRCTTYTLPCTAELAKQCQVPLATIIKPFANVPKNEVRQGR